ncbi:hypothetical protein JMY81_04400 [Brenneria goodwinii]|nr:hypothetical protein [Brenneria goodwinii]MCG8160077.1 hypothetical protein [Brenneria goodwinii]MCG8164600.1 hypothetical protein [Brenneria goodwinii]MCG8170694.1 hypothetical protein [Brenneria goodwinii]MCG8174222.1 hypothetical protein [Brenneria goodwinii]
MITKEYIPEEVDILSSNTMVDENEINSISTLTIDHKNLYFLVQGTYISHGNMGTKKITM